MGNFHTGPEARVSLTVEWACPDYNELSPSDMGVLKRLACVVIFCFLFITINRKRHNVVGRIVDHPITSDP